jgi:hypothetical protein
MRAMMTEVTIIRIREITPPISDQKAPLAKR